MHNDPVIKIEDSKIPVINEYKFLGVIFNKKLTFIPHRKYLKINQPMPNNFCELLPIQSGELTVKPSLNYTELFSAHNLTMAFLYIYLPGDLISKNSTLFPIKA